MNYQLSPVFAVPLAQDHYPDQEKLNEELKTLILLREAQGAEYANPNPSLTLHAGVFESDFNFFSWPDVCVQQLKEFVWRVLGRAVRDTNNYSAQELARIQIFSHTWFHVTRHGGFTVLHTHPMASWSGVYCVTPGETPANRPESGVLRFHNPHYYSNYFMDAGNHRFRPPYHHGTWSIPLQPGQLVLFPSWLQHEVLPFYGSDERITIAFNCWFKVRE